MADDPKQRRAARIERSGPVERLTPRVEAFLRERLGAVSLDEDGDVEKRPDYVCLKGLVAVEIKSLETDPSGRLDNAVEPEKASEAWPVFFGQWPIESVLKHLPDGERVNRKLIDRLGRTLVSHVKKANDQLGQHAARAGRRNLVRLLVLLNEDHPEYTPEIVSFLIHRELARTSPDGHQRNNQIDAVIYISDRHAAPTASDLCLPIIVLYNEDIALWPWKENIVDFILGRWADWNGVPVLQAEPENVALADFVAAEHIPDEMARHEAWALEYRRRPYMRSWTDENVRNLWDHIMLLSLLWGHVSSPIKVPKEGFIQAMERFTHALEEAARRGLPLAYFEEESINRRRQVVDSLPYGPKAAEWLHGMLNQWVSGAKPGG